MRDPALAAFSGLATALAAVLLAALAGPPYLSLGELNPWTLVYGVALFVALISVPFLLERSLRPAIAAHDARWERTMLLWGAISLGVGALGALVGLAGGFSGDSLAGSAGLVTVIAAALVVGTLLAWVLSG